MTTREFEKIQQDIDEAQTRKAKLTGALEQLQERMQKEYNVGTVAELQALLEKTRAQQDKLQVKYDTNVTELEEMVVEIA
jgi:predicted  nucleic acid-binding Zn-ribbon protein